MKLGFGLVAQIARRGSRGQRDLDLGAVADALIAALGEAAPDIAPLMRRSTTQDGVRVIRVLPFADPIRLEPAGADTIRVRARTGAIGPGYHALLINALVTVAAKQGFAWTEENNQKDETGFFSNREMEQLGFRFRENMSISAGAMLGRAGTSPPVFGLPQRLEPRVPDGMVATLRGFRPRALLEQAQSGAEDEARAIFPWWDYGGTDPGAAITAQAGEGLAEALLWTEFPWRAPLDPAERVIGETATKLMAHAGPEAAPTIPVDMLETILAAQVEIEPDPDGPGYRRGVMERPVPGRLADRSARLFPPSPRGRGRGSPPGGSAPARSMPASSRRPRCPCSPRARRMRRPCRMRFSRPDRRRAKRVIAPRPAFDPYVLLEATEREIAFVHNGCFYSGVIGTFQSEDWSAPEFVGEVIGPDAMARCWMLFRGVEDSAWVLETFRSLRPGQPKSAVEL